MSSKDTNEDLEWEEWDGKTPFLKHMIAGSVAGLTEHISIFPIDTIKTHVQCEKCGSVSPLQTWNCAEGIIRREGVFRLWRGVSAMFAGCIPAHAAYFSVFETVKNISGANREGHHPVGAALSGAAASFSHDICMNPFDTVKQRMQLGHYKSVYHCIRTIISTEGAAAFYLSFPTTLIMNLPYGCIMVAINESCRKILNPSGEYSVSSSMLSGAVAGTTAAAFTNPLDVIKTRLQTQNLAPCPQTIESSANFTQIHQIRKAEGVKSIFVTVPENSQISPRRMWKINSASDAAKAILREDGMKGFTRGVLARILVHAPSVAVSWTAYETMKEILTEHDMFPFF